jgi:hypothetical protein
MIEAELQKTPDILIAGDRESPSSTVSLRAHVGHDVWPHAVAEVADRIPAAARPGEPRPPDGASPRGQAVSARPNHESGSRRSGEVCFHSC